MYDAANTLTQKIKFMREAAIVRRCHTVPILNSDQYVVGLHSFNMLAMLRLLNPTASHALIWAVLEHDLPERLTGDIPAPTKWFDVVNRTELGRMEKIIAEKVVGKSHEAELSYEERKWLRALDIFELALFCRDQIMLGNRNLEVMLNRIHEYVTREAAMLAEPVLDVYWASFHEDWNMMPDLGDT